MEIKKVVVDTIECQKVGLGYSDESNRLSNVNLLLERGKTYVLKGNSGSGKSILLKSLTGLIIPVSGKILYNQLPIQEMSFEEFLPFRLRIGYGFSHGGLLNNKSLIDNLKLPMEYHRAFPASEILSRCKEIFSSLKLEKYENLRPSVVPLSVRRIIANVRAFALEPDFVFLDDPTSALSREHFDVFLEWLHQKESLHSTGLFIATQSTEFIKSFNFTEYALKDGTLDTRQQKLEVAG